MDGRLFSIDSKIKMNHINPLKTEGILRKFQKVILLTQKWEDSKNNGTI
jgi:hypothetical protein